jgi:hypothetical protein
VTAGRVETRTRPDLRATIVAVSSILLTAAWVSPSYASSGSSDANQVTERTSAAAAYTTLPLTGLTQMVVDDVHGHVFLTGFSQVLPYAGTNDSKVVVINFDGSIETTFTDLPGAAGLYLDAANNRLWVAESAGDALQVIDTDTLTLGPTYSLGANADCPGAVTQAGGMMWVYVGCGTNGGGLASFDPASSTVTGFGSAAAGVLLRVDPADTDLVFTTGIGGTTLYEYDVSSGTPSVVMTSGGSSQGWYSTKDVAVMPDGSDVIGAAIVPYYLDALKIPDLSGDVQYATGEFPHAVTASSDSKFVIGGTDSVIVFKTGTASTYRVIDPSLTGGGVAERGLALNASASKLFVVTGDQFRVVPDPTKLPSKVTVASSHKKVDYPDKVRLTAHVSPFDPGEVVTLFAKPYGGKKKAFAQGPVNSSGNFSASFRPERLTDLSATAKGDEHYLPAKSGAVSVEVQVNTTGRMRRYYGIAGRYRLYHLGHPVFFTCSVKPNLAGQRVLVAYQFPTRTEGWTTAGHRRFTLRKDSTVTIYIAGLPRGSYRIICDYRGDAAHLRDYSRFSYFKVT